MLLAREQRIAALVLFGLALAGWIGYAAWPSRQPLPDDKPHKRPWAERKDSIRMADSLRYVQWKEEREARYDSFRMADSMRHVQWKAERQARWDSMRIVRQAEWDSVRRADSLWRDSVGWRYVRKNKKDTVLDLNRCDTADLQLIRGIGRFTAMQIIRYREALGGFFSPQQLTDEPFRTLHLDTLTHHFITHAEDIRPIPVNNSSTERLNRHPYLRFEQAKAIYTLRRKHIRLTSINDLRTLPELTEDDLLRLEPYLSFE